MAAKCILVASIAIKSTRSNINLKSSLKQNGATLTRQQHWGKWENNLNTNN